MNTNQVEETEKDVLQKFRVWLDEIDIGFEVYEYAFAFYADKCDAGYCFPGMTGMELVSDSLFVAMLDRIRVGMEWILTEKFGGYFSIGFDKVLFTHGNTEKLEQFMKKYNVNKPRTKLVECTARFIL